VLGPGAVGVPGLGAAEVVISSCFRFNPDVLVDVLLIVLSKSYEKAERADEVGNGNQDGPRTLRLWHHE
jgi:hypothetical protein